MSRRRLAPLMVVAATAVAASAATRHVPSEYPTIQDAIDASTAGDVVLVAPGIYTDVRTRLIWSEYWTGCAFLADGVTLRSEGGPQVTILDPQQSGGPNPVVLAAMYLPSDETAVEGFTVTGVAPGGNGAVVHDAGGWITFRNCVFRDLDAGSGFGAGIRAYGNLRLENCVFANCVARMGGAVRQSLGRVEMLRCVIRDCGDVGVALMGGGDVVESSYLEGCTFEECWEEQYGVAALHLYNNTGGSVVRNCRFARNVSTRDIVLVSSLPPAPMVVEGCLFWHNDTKPWSTEFGVLTVSYSEAAVRNNTFFGNSAGTTLAFRGPPGTWRLENNIVAGNEVGAAGAVYVMSPPLLTSSCNVFWDNPPGYTPGGTDRVVDPLLCDPLAGNFYVDRTSPCAPENSGGCGLIGAFPVGCGPIALARESWARTKARYR